MTKGWFVESTEPVAVPVGECLCPGAPHSDGDTVFLRPELDPGGGMAVMRVAATGDGDTASIEERLGRAYLVWGIVSWTFVDEEGKPVPCTRENIRKLRWNDATYAIADKASDLYGDALDPLVTAVNRLALTTSSSRNGRTTPPTSRTRSGSASRRRP